MGFFYFFFDQIGGFLPDLKFVMFFKKTLFFEFFFPNNLENPDPIKIGIFKINQKKVAIREGICNFCAFLPSPIFGFFFLPDLKIWGFIFTSP